MTGLQDEKADITHKDIMEYRELTEKIIGCAYRVYNNMGFGFLESVYEKCLLIELKKEGLQAETQKPITVTYGGEVVGEFKADIIVGSTVIVELKSGKKIICSDKHLFPTKDGDKNLQNGLKKGDILFSCNN